jgi:hypothetical protein
MATTTTLPFGSDGTTGLSKLMVHIVLATAICAALTACPDDKSSEETGPASGGTSGDQAAGETGPDATPQPEPTRPEAMPMLCTLGAGKWCDAPCPKGDAGPLCCAEETCTPWDVDGLACDGAVGWCDNYTLVDSLKAEAAPKTAVCHDEI